MRKIVLLLFLVSLLISANYGVFTNDLEDYRTCQTCGMERKTHVLGRMLLEYYDGSKAGTCSLRCTAVDMAAYREKTITSMMAADYATGKLVDARKAIWVIGGGRTGVMTRRAKWAFEDKAAAEEFVRKHKGRVADYDGVMKAAFSDMAGDITVPQSRKSSTYTKKNDIETLPDCKYCGMDRRKFDFSRMLVAHEGSVENATCSIHCAAIDLSLAYGKAPGWIGVGDYQTRKLIDARRAYWVIGGDKTGVMSIQGKWAFENRKDAIDFTRAHGGRIGRFDGALQAAFEDMWEILR